MMSKQERKEVARILRVVMAVRAVDPEMKIQTLETLLRIALSGGKGVTELQHEVGISLASASRNVSLLSRVNMKGAKALGFIDLREVPEDRRYKVAKVLPKGEQFLKSLAQASNPEVTHG